MLHSVSFTSALVPSKGSLGLIIWGFSSSEDKFSIGKVWLYASTCIGVESKFGRWLTPKVLLEPICYDLLDVSLERNLFPDDQNSDLKGVQFDLAKTDHSLWLGVRDKPFFAAVDLLKVKDQVCLSLIFICVDTIHEVVILPSQIQRLALLSALRPNFPIICCTSVNDKYSNWLSTWSAGEGNETRCSESRGHIRKGGFPH